MGPVGLCQPVRGPAMCSLCCRLSVAASAPRHGDAVGGCAFETEFAEVAFALGLVACACVRVWFDHLAPEPCHSGDGPSLMLCEGCTGKKFPFVVIFEGGLPCQVSKCNPSPLALGCSPIEVREALFFTQMKEPAEWNSRWI